MRITYAHGSRFYRYFCITVLFIFQTDMSPKWFWIQNEYSNDGKQQHLTSIRLKDIKTRHVKIIRYLQSWIAMSIDFEQQISHNAFRLLYACKSKPYSHAHTCATTRGFKWTEKRRIQIEVDFCMMLKYWKQCSVPIYPLHAAQVKPNASFKPIIILQ